jgi:hypothetical protein
MQTHHSLTALTEIEPAPVTACERSAVAGGGGEGEEEEGRVSARRLGWQGGRNIRRGRGGDESLQRGAHGHPVSVVGGVGMMAWKAGGGG